MTHKNTSTTKTFWFLAMAQDFLRRRHTRIPRSHSYIRWILFLGSVLSMEAFAQVPAILSVAPDTALQGQTLLVTITGQNTTFTIASGTGTINNISSVWISQGSSIINGTNVSATSATTVSTNFSIPSNATTGSWNVNVLPITGSLLTLINGITVIHNPPLPPTPQNLTASAGNGQVALSWNKILSSRFLKYLIYRGTFSGGELLLDSTSSGITDTTRMSAGLLNGQSYYFYVTAIDSSRLESAKSNEASATPVPPPTISSIVPDSAMQGQLLTVTITGQNTNFTVASASGTLNNVNSVWFSQGTSTINATNFLATSATNLSASFAIPSNAFVGNWNVNVTPTTGSIATLNNGFIVTAPQLSLTETALTFPDRAFSDSAQAIVYAVNKSLTTMTITGITTANAAFSVSLTTPANINGHDSLALVVKFKPVTFGLAVDTVKIVSTAGNFNVLLTGNSPRPGIQFSTQRIVFANTGIYDTSAALISITNSSQNILQIDSIVTRTHAFVPAFRTHSVAKGDTVQLVVRFVPAGFGSVTDSLLVWNNGVSPLLIVDLSGKCPFPAIVTYSSQINFGVVKKDSTSQKLFSIQDSSVSRLQIDSLWTGTKYFDVVHQLANRIVKHGDSLSISVRFTPDTSRAYVDTLYIANTSQVTLTKIPLSGNGTTTNVMQSGSEFPKIFTLSQNYPNPFNPSTTILFGVPARSRVRLVIFNILGQQVVELANEEIGAGYFQRTWNATVASGLYFYRIEAVSVENPNRTFVDVKKMILLK